MVPREKKDVWPEPRIGIFQLVPAPERPTDNEAIEQALREIDFAEAAGFDSVWIAEHHLSSFGLVGAPSVYAAAIAQRTRRIGIGYAVAVVPLHHPVRLAEEISWLTHLAPGRISVGLGSGFSPFELEGYGVAPEERRARFIEGCAVLEGLLGEDAFEHRGRFWTVPPVRLRPRPFGGKPPLLRACSSRESIGDAARRGQRILLGLKTPPELAAAIDRYRSARSAIGVLPDELDREIGDIPVLRRITIGESDDEARDIARRAVGWEANTARRPSGDDPAAGSEPPGGHDALAGGCVGTAATVIAELRRVSELGLRRIIAWVNFGDMPYDRVRTTMEILARDVIPAFRAEDRRSTAVA